MGGDGDDPVLRWGERLRRWRSEDRCWSQQELVDQIVRLAFATREDRGTRLDARLVGRWESGQVRRPQAVYRRLLAQLDAPLPADPARPVETSTGIHESSRTGRIDPTVIESVAGRVGQVAARYETEPSATLLAEAAQHHAALMACLDRTGSGHAREQLHRAISSSAALLGQLVWDASGRRDGAAAAAYCKVAAENAAAGGDRAAVANAELRTAYIWLYGPAEERDPRAGLARAMAATEHSRGVSNALHGVAQLHVAEALGMVGEYRRCEQALRAAERAFDAIGRDDVAAEMYSPAQFGRLAGSCYLSLGHPERAESFLSGVLELLGERRKTKSLVLGNLATSHIRQRRLDAATATLHEAIDLLEQGRGGGGMSVVFAAGRELYPWRGEPEVQDVHDRLLGLISRS
jgi:tetratricopeptide (TPR) repeat protein